jgi:hypothetical protein
MRDRGIENEAVGMVKWDSRYPTTINVCEEHKTMYLTGPLKINFIPL